MKNKEKYEYDDGDNFFWDCVGMTSGIMIIICLICIFTILICNIDKAHGGELDAWEFNIMGINPADFQDRKVLPIIGGMIVSLVAHEIGHLASAELMGADPYFNWSERVAYAGDGYDDWSDDQKALYSGAGFIAQTLTGAILTAIPKTRHSDFTLGFNFFSSVNGFYYGFTDGADAESSDTILLDENGYSGTAIALTSGVTNGVLTYISLNKEK